MQETRREQSENQERILSFEKERQEHQAQRQFE